MTILKASEPSILRVGFDPAKFSRLRQSQKEHVVYHLLRVLNGDGSAVTEWEHLGMKVDVRPWKAARVAREGKAS